MCGMFVAKYPTWVAALVLEEGRRLYFDGPKDMFRYLHDPERYGAEEEFDADDVVEVWVTDYYSARPIDAEAALFVIGSDVMGPMGPELVALANRDEAETFRADHGGDLVLEFDEVTSEVVPP